MLRWTAAEDEIVLADLAVTWLGEAHEHQPMLRLVLLDPWHEQIGEQHHDTPD